MIIVSMCGRSPKGDVRWTPGGPRTPATHGACTSVQGQLTGHIQQIQGTTSVCASIKADGSVVTWGGQSEPPPAFGIARIRPSRAPPGDSEDASTRQCAIAVPLLADRQGKTLIVGRRRAFAGPKGAKLRAPLTILWRSTIIFSGTSGVDRDERC